jgi:formate dehydrogenase (NADP+) beta subunit
VLCGGCVDVCPTSCLKLVLLSDLATHSDQRERPIEGTPAAGLDATGDLNAAIAHVLGPEAARDQNSAILKDEDRCIRCALCAIRCPVDAITMERVQFTTTWSVA